MKRKWMRRVAIFLTLCLLMDEEGQFSFAKLQAMEAGSTVMEGTGTAVLPDNASENHSKSVNVSSRKAADSNDVDQEVIVIRNAAAGNSESNLPVVSVSENDLAEIGLPPEGEMLGDPVADEIDAEADELMLLAAELDTFPATIDEYLAVAGQAEFVISTKQDFINAQTVCADARAGGFAGKTLIIGSPKGGGTTWDLKTEMDGFVGIGTEENPFRGTLKCGYDRGVDFSINKPMIKWLGDGATVTQLRINSSASCAGIAENVSGNVTIANNIYIDGTIGDNWNVAGAIAANISDGSTLNVNNVVIGSNGGFTIYGTDSGAIAGNIGNECTVIIDNVPIVNGNIFSLSGSASAGTIAGNIGERSSVTMSNVSLATGGAYYIAGGAAGVLAGNIGAGSSVTVSNISGMIPQISGTTVGGLAGTLGSGATVSLGDSVGIGTSGQIAILGTEAAGGYFGVVTGNHTWDLADQSKVNTRVIADSTVSFAGQFAGKLINDGSEGTLTVVGGNSVTVQISGAGNCGGLVGLCGENTNIAVPAGGFTIEGTVASNQGRAGGVVGVVEAGSAMEFADYTVSATVGGSYAGGIVGELRPGQYIIRDVTVGTVRGASGAGGAGGLAGHVITSAVEIQGTVSIPNMPSGYGQLGRAVGAQETSLIYFAEVEGKLNGASQIVTERNENEKEIGSYGGIYRNQQVAEEKLIGDGTLANVGVINRNHIIAYSGGWYQMTSAADFEILAIVLGTDGAFGSYAFEGYTSWSDLLTAGYSVLNDVDISYDKTGIVTLNRNDKTNDTKYAFKGKMQAVGGLRTITQNISVGQSNGGLFTLLSENTYFAGLTFDGTVKNANGVGGIAYAIVGGSSLELIAITMKKNFESNSGIVGGVVANKQDNNKDFDLRVRNITLASTIEHLSSTDYSGFITRLSRADVDIDGVTLGGTLKGTSSSNAGGFLGRSWSNIGGTIANVSVQQGTVYESSATFGALWNTLTNNTSAGKHVTLKNFDLNGLTVNANQNRSNSALLVYNATALVADIVDYSCSGCTVNNPGAFFDEVAGFSRTGETVPTLPSNSGIISLHSSTANFPEYHYDYQATYNGGNGGRFNKSTIYYYDLFQYLEDGSGNVTTKIEKVGGANSFVLDTPGKVLLWNASQMANTTIRNTFAKYFSDNTVPNAKTQTAYFKGTLDLSTISYYPTPKVDNGTYIGQDNARIIFGAKTNAQDMGTWRLSNEAIEASQHYGLQAGLFVNELGNMYLDVSDMTFTGTIANLDFRSGVILTGEVGLADGCTVKNITLDDLWIADYTTATATGGHRVGLLISKISGNTAIFENIEMVNYDACRTSDVKAAATLIAYAGGDSNTNITLSFRNMKITDDKDGGNLHNGDALAHASFICNYDYTDNVELYTGSGMYLFSEEDFNSGDVTLGNELDIETEFSDTTNKVLDVMQVKGLGTNESYIPYICHDPACYQFQSEYIEINPKTGDILKGCGTYEDPYIIENEKQFLTLYRYLSETAGNPNDYQYRTFYELGDGWKIIKPGTDKTFCSAKHNVTYTATGFTGNGAGDAVIFGEDDFPTPRELSHSYFQLANDIDLSSIVSTTYSKIAEEFIGFGSNTVPFAGVWDGNGYTITLPVRDSMHANAIYGFIQYAEGVVVKDLHLLVDGNTAEAYEAKMAAKISGVGGGIIGTILGGDNIIDNVTADVELVVSATGAVVGGYVGIIKKGGLILRNVKDTSLSKFSTNQSQGTTYPFIGAVVGKVEDGYVLYEGAGSAGSYLWEGKGGNTLYPAVPNYSILNGDKLEADAGGMDVVLSGTDVTVTIPGAAGLQIMSMAMNADALNVRSTNWLYSSCGYTERSRSRKAAYSDIGCTTQTEDYLAAAKYDNVMGYNANADKAYTYPYLYQYMGITGDEYLTFYAEDNARGFSILNPSTLIGGTAYYVTWELAANSTFDMSQFGKSFRGIGALYQTGGGNGGTFHGNFHGNGSRIHLEMEREILGAETGSAVTLYRVALFNTLYGGAEDLYKVEADFKDTEATTSNIVNCFEISDFKLSGSIENSAASVAGSVVQAGGVVANIDSGNYIFSNISVDRDNPLNIGKNKISGISYAGGLVGIVEQWKTHILIENCNFAGSQANPMVVQGTQYVGGLVGQVRGANSSILKITNTSMDYVNVTSNSLGAGGLVGYAPDTVGALICEGSSASPVRVSNCQIAGRITGGLIGNVYHSTYIRYAVSEHNEIGFNNVQYAGGVIGTGYGSFAIADVTCDDLVLRAYNYIGGVVGSALVGNTRQLGSSIKDVVVTDVAALEEYDYYSIDTGGIGGIVGRNDQTLTIQNVKVSGTKTGDTYHCILEASDKTRRGSNGVGGVVGNHNARTLTLENCNVNTVSLSTDIIDGNRWLVGVLSAGGIVGYVGSGIVLEGDITAENLDISAPLGEMAAVSVRPAGGCFGYVKAKISGEADSYYQGLCAASNTVSGRQAGGIAGYVNSAAEIRLSGVEVKDGSVVSDEIAGGMIGYLSPKDTGVAFNEYGQVTEDTVNQISNMTIAGRVAGGAFGSLNGSGPLRAENISIQNNTVVSSIVNGNASSAGGVIGDCSFPAAQTVELYDVRLGGNVIVSEAAGNALSDTEKDKLAVGGVIGKLAVSTSAGEIFLDRITVGSDNQIGVRREGSKDVKLIRKDGDAYLLSDIRLPAAGEQTAADYAAIESLEQDYGYYVGSVVGVTEADNIQLYMLWSGTVGKPITPVMEKNPPVVDVARLSNQGVDDYRKYCHIIYGAAVVDSDGAAVAGDAGRNVADMKAEAEKAESEYTGSERYEELLAEIRLPKEKLELFDAIYRDNYALPGTDLNIDFPVLVYNVQYGTLQEVMECVTDVMTNMAGDSASNMNILSITCTPKLYDGTSVTNGTTVSINASVSGGRTTYSFGKYDGLRDGKLSYTEMTFTYGWSDDHVKVFRIPVFVEEPILYSVHSKMMAGKVTAVDTIREQGASETEDSLIMANDSDYTLLLEYSYSSAREQFATGVDKVFYLTENDNLKSLPVGKQLLLIDVTNGNKAYYYTVESENVTKIKFTDFKDSNGNSYVNQAINRLADETDEGKDYYTDLAGHELTGVGIERFLLVALTGDEIPQNTMYSIHSGIEIADSSLASRFLLEENHKKETVWFVNSIPGLNVSLTGKGEETSVKGTISKAGGVAVKSQFALAADSLYWAEKKNGTLMDSSNSGKYLDLAFYLRNQEDNRVNLPGGTNLSYRYQAEDGSELYSANKVIPDNTLIYYYKSIREAFGMDDFEYVIENIHENTTVSVEYLLDFSGADLSNITEEKYIGWIELLRTANRDYPMGTGNMVDYYTEEIEANAAPGLGFALKADELEQLGINTYPVAEAADTIDAHVMFDFGDILKAAGTGKDVVVTKWSNLDYEVNYQIYKKTVNNETTVIYEKYTGTDVSITATEGVVSSESGNGSLKAVYNFSEYEIANGNGDTPVEGLVTFPCQITLDTADLTQDLSNLTNYKIVATLTIKERGDSGEDDAAKTTTDFFIYTVTKLKLDL